MCFGDSLTWGWIPVAEGAPTLRYPFAERWTGAMAAQLGAGFEIVEEGLSAVERARLQLAHRTKQRICCGGGLVGF